MKVEIRSEGGESLKAIYSPSHDIDIQEIDIRRDPDLFERYRYRQTFAAVEK